MFVFTAGCTDNYIPDESKTVFNEELYNNIEKIQSLKDEESSLEKKMEFLQLFEKAAGISLPNSFVFPPITTDYSGWAYVVETSSCFLINTHFVAKKTEAIEMLEVLKKDDNWRGFLYWKNNFGSSDENAEKNKSKCTFFKKGNWNVALGSENIISLNFHYNKQYDNYIIWLHAIIRKD